MKTKKQVDFLAYIDSMQSTSLDFLKTLVGFDSEFIDQGVGGNELPIQKWLEAELASWGLKTRLFEPDNVKLQEFSDYNPGHDYTNRPNLVAIHKGTGKGKSLILNGHVDTVPVGDVARWSHDPLAGEVCGDLIYGRGTCDMKAGLAAMMLAVRYLREAGSAPEGDVIIQSVVDEEGGGNGTLACVAEGYKADAAVVGEPTGLKVLPSSRGVYLLKIDVQGKSTHAALKWTGVNAIEKAMKIAQGLADLERLWLANRNHPLLPSPTITLGQINGGVAGAIVPESCCMTFDVKYLPSETDTEGNETLVNGESVKVEVEDWIAGICAGDSWLREHPPVLDWYLHVVPHNLDVNHPFVEALSSSCEKVIGKSIVSGMPSGADARILQNEGHIPTVICGPGDLSDAHSIDEHISVSSYFQAIKVYALMIFNWTGRGTH